MKAKLLFVTVLVCLIIPAVCYANSIPQVGTVTPQPGTSTPYKETTITSTFIDADGYQDIKHAVIAINDNATVQNHFYAYYEQTTNKLYLTGDTASYTLGSNNTLQNSFVKLDVSKTTISGAGNTLTINWVFTFEPACLGYKRVYLAMRDMAGALNDGPWVQKGNWNIVNQIPEVGTVTPQPGTSTPYKETTITTTFIDEDGAEDIKHAVIAINGSTANHFYAYYEQTTNKFYMTGDAASYVAGSNNIIENAYAKLDISKTIIQKQGNTLTINWAFTFKPACLGYKKVYLVMRDMSGALNDGVWVQKGNWNIVNQIPEVGTVTPSPGSSAPNEEATITTTYIDADGYQDIQHATIAINSTTNNQNCFYAYYEQTTDKLYMLSASGQWLSYPVGSNNIIEGTYTRLDISKTTLQKQGNTLTINWAVTFKPTPLIHKSIYIVMRDMSNVLNDGVWINKGTWFIGEDPPEIQEIIPTSTDNFHHGMPVLIEVAIDVPGQSQTEYRYSKDGVIIQDWTTSNQIDWTPTEDDIGYATFQVEARNDNPVPDVQQKQTYIFREPVRAQ